MCIRFSVCNPISNEFDMMLYGFNISAEWKKYESSQYLFVSTPRLNQTGARAKCQEYGADLVSIARSQENDFIEENSGYICFI